MQSLQRQPLRSFISTHQWMPWNFYPFQIIGNNNQTWFKYKESGFEVALEPRYVDIVNKETLTRFQTSLDAEDFKWAYSILQWIPQLDRVESKWRTPFFICRPALCTEDIIISEELLETIDKGVITFLNKILDEVEVLYKSYHNKWLTWEERLTMLETLLYFQSDVYISKNWNIQIEAIQMPDVWFFLETLSDNWSLRKIKSINRELRNKVVNTIVELKDNIIFLTGKNVIDGKEDVLEQRELQVLVNDLKWKDVVSDVISVEDFIFDPQKKYILMNFDYTDSIKRKLFLLSEKFPQNFFPNPHLQFTSKGMTGYNTITISWKISVDKFRWMTFSTQKKSEESFFQEMNEYLGLIWIHPQSEIFYIKRNDGQMLYVYRNSLYSLRKVKTFLENQSEFILIENPHQDGHSRIQKDWYDILHSYRFMYVWQ